MGTSLAWQKETKQRLLQREAEVMRLHIEENRTQAEIAKLLGYSQMTISKDIKRALGRLEAHSRKVTEVYRDQLSGYLWRELYRLEDKLLHADDRTYPKLVSSKIAIIGQLAQLNGVYAQPAQTHEQSPVTFILNWHEKSSNDSSSERDTVITLPANSTRVNTATSDS